MAAPKPIVLTQVDEGSFTEPVDPQPFVVVGDVPFTATVEVDAADVTAEAVGDGTATDVQGILEELEARIAAVEDALEA